MPLFEVTDEELVPFRRVQAGPDLYEKEIEDLMWDNLEAFTGTALFRVCRQPRIATGGRPDIVALDASGRVHVIEIKRDIDRSQLAQCLEYAGWARSTNLDELAGIFFLGPEAFFAAWMEFTESAAPQLVSRAPQLTLVARDFDQRTDDALAFLTDSNLPIEVLRVVVYEDQEHRRFIDIEGDNDPVFDEPPLASESISSGPVHLKIDGRRIQLSSSPRHLALQWILLMLSRMTVGTRGRIRPAPCSMCSDVECSATWPTGRQQPPRMKAHSAAIAELSDSSAIGVVGHAAPSASDSSAERRLNVRTQLLDLFPLIHVIQGAEARSTIGHATHHLVVAERCLHVDVRPLRKDRCCVGQLDQRIS